MELRTLSGRPASALGLGGQPQMATECIPAAWAAGINYFFFYNLSFAALIDGLQPLVQHHRTDIVVATGSEERDPAALEEYRAQVQTRLELDQIDIFFAEYVNPSDDMDQVGQVLDQLQAWKAQGLIRYVGATTHNRPLALELIDSGQIDVLMQRYNMAHRGAEERVLPAAQEAGISVVAFTCTRWGSLLAGHRDWTAAVPTAADCYAYALAHPAVPLALIAPKTVEQLQENVGALRASLGPERSQWEQYGALVYGDGRDSFETEWP